MTPRVLLLVAAIASCQCATAPASAAATTPVATGNARPNWLSDLSLGVKESYDSNLLLVSGRTPGLPEKSSWITDIAPKIGFNLVPFLGDQTTCKTCSLVYTPEFFTYHDAAPESYNSHRLAFAAKGGSDGFSFALDASLFFIDGSTTAATYALNQGPDPAGQYDKNRSHFAHEYARDRRKQVQDRENFTLQYDMAAGFVRAVGSIVDIDMMTDWHNASTAPYIGYQNYVDRRDAGIGVDLGFSVHPGFALTLGYRYGHQYQQAYPNNIDGLVVRGQQAQGSNDYQRLLVGLDGKPCDWLNIHLALGPDYRDFNPATPVDDLRHTTFFGEAAITATLSSSDSLTFNYRSYEWLSSTGKLPFIDSSYALAYSRKATAQLTCDVGFRYKQGNYTVGSPTLSNGASNRKDSEYTFTLGANWVLSPHWSANFSYAGNFGRNLLDNIAQAEYREYDHHLVTVGVLCKF